MCLLSSRLTTSVTLSPVTPEKQQGKRRQRCRPCKHKHMWQTDRNKADYYVSLGSFQSPLTWRQSFIRFCIFLPECREREMQMSTCARVASCVSSTYFYCVCVLSVAISNLCSCPHWNEPCVGHPILADCPADPSRFQLAPPSPRDNVKTSSQLKWMGNPVHGGWS